MDGTLMLTWQPVEHNATHFASDGYIYGDAEQSTKSDVRGYVRLSLPNPAACADTMLDS